MNLTEPTPAPHGYPDNGAPEHPTATAAFERLLFPENPEPKPEPIKNYGNEETSRP